MTDTPAEDRLLYPAEAAAALKVNKKTLWRLQDRGRLRPSFTLGGHRRYKESEVTALREALAAEADLLNTDDVARVFRVGRARVCIWVTQGKLTPVPGIRGTHGQYLFRPEDVTELLREGGEP